VIELHFIDVEVPGLNSELLVLWLCESILREGKMVGDINLVFCDDEHLLGINRTYLNHDYYTDIVTFDYSQDDAINGDLYISIERITENATELNEVFDVEFKRVCVHGVLHLCGYNDKSIEDEALMRDRENFHLDKYVSRET
jgi:rRNA maturation RNase YbeY